MDKQYYMFFTALIISVAVTPIVIKIALKIGVLDVPKDSRRVHKVPVPLMGGLAIYFAFIITTALFMPSTKQILGLIAGATVITISGLMDDIKPMKARTKLLIQTIAALILVYSGTSIKVLTNPFDRVTGMADIGILSIPATIFWVAGITNAFNLIDGLDGLAAGVASISCITLFIVSMINDRMTAMMLTAALAGSTIGFLPYNFHPAKIFMGDTGAQLLGFLLAAVSIQGAIKSAAAVAITVPVLALGLPIYDTSMAILRRFINGRPVMEADRGHLHHKLLDLGLSQRQAVIIMYFISGIFGVSAIFISELSTMQSFFFLLLLLLIVMTLSKGIGVLKRDKSEGSQQ